MPYSEQHIGLTVSDLRDNILDHATFFETDDLEAGRRTGSSESASKSLVTPEIEETLLGGTLVGRHRSSVLKSR